MTWFRRLTGRNDEPRDEPDPGMTETRELLDPYHQRASLTDGDSAIVVPSEVFDNVALAMERVDFDINTAISTRTTSPPPRN